MPGLDVVDCQLRVALGQADSEQLLVTVEERRPVVAAESRPGPPRLVAASQERLLALASPL